LAWARLSRMDALLYFYRDDTATASWGDAAKHALETAQKLEPNSPETLLALGWYQYRVLPDYGLAKTTFKQVSKMLPSSSEVPFALGAVTRREGHWDQSIAYFEQALALDPRNSELLSDIAANLSLAYAAMGEKGSALEEAERSTILLPRAKDSVSGPSYEENLP